MAGGLSATWLLACATKPEQPTAFAPEIGHYQPLPTPPSDAETSETSSDAGETNRASSQPPALPTAHEDALCRHIVKLVQSESKERATADQTAELIASCALALAHDRRRLGEEEFQRRAACMSAATTVAEFTPCKSPPANE